MSGKSRYLLHRIGRRSGPSGNSLRHSTRHPNPLTYQMALNLPDDLYRHFLAHMILEDEEVYRLVEKGLVTENEYLDIRLWYHNGPFRDHWLGPLGVDGTGYLYGLTRLYRKPNTYEMHFYVMDDYYRRMNHLPE